LNRFVHAALIAAASFQQPGEDIKIAMLMLASAMGE
jgi:hypothetical protein